MKKQIVSILAVLALIPASLAFACTEDGQHGIFPDNKMYIPASSFGAYNISESQFNASIARMEKLYTPIFATQNRQYKVVAAWTDGTVNAFADRAGSVSQVHMFGGLARHPKVTPDAFELVICHETGHHMGGAPRKKSLFSTSWAANEGEADYYATITCGRLLWANDDNETIVSKMEIPAVVTEQCQKSFDKPNDLAICKREAMAGKSLADTLADLGKTPVTDFATPSKAVVAKMFDAHPEAQCRLDTYFQGALCAKTTPSILSDSDPTADVCSQEKGDVLGVRPVCWYKPLEKGAPSGGGSSWPSSKLSSR
jgi:hypothetical protein